VDGYEVVLSIDGERKRHPFGVVVYVREEVPTYVTHMYSDERKGEACCLTTILCDGVAVCVQTPIHTDAQGFHHFQLTQLFCRERKNHGYSRF